jgi:hypothetical protein
MNKSANDANSPRSKTSRGMTALILCLLFTVAVPRLCFADVTRLSSQDRGVLQDSSRFHEVHSTRDFPAAVVALCTNGVDKLAEPGEKWNATDSITDPTLPAKRLIWAAIGGEYYVVHFERGGIAHTYHILVAKLANNGGEPKVVWQAVGGPLEDYAAFLDALRSGKLDDRLGNSKFW